MARIPPLGPDKMDAEQRAVHDRIVAKGDLALAVEGEGHRTRRPVPTVGRDDDLVRAEGPPGCYPDRHDLAGPEGRALQERLVETVRLRGMRMVGPNCMGLLNTSPRVRLNASFSPIFPPGGKIGLPSQSGALGLACKGICRCEERAKFGMRRRRVARLFVPDERLAGARAQ